MFDLSGKRALITGASGGIGREIAIALHKQGAHVALSGTREAVLSSLVKSIGDGSFSIPADLSRPSGPKKLIAEATNILGGIDILVNNAGVTRDGLSMRMRDEDWQMVIDVNLTSVFRLTRECLRGMLKSRWGRIIGVTSVVGVTGNSGQTNYAASKAGMIGMSKSLALEVASRGITVNCVAPGFIESPMTSGLTIEQKENIFGRIPVGRMGDSEEIAAAVVYLASKQASYITGQTLHINGGLAMI